MANSNLKPLKPGSPTGFWKYDGEWLSAEEKARLEADGVRFPAAPFVWTGERVGGKVVKDPAYDAKQVDVMPDNRLKPLRLRNKRPVTRRVAVMEGLEFDEQYEAWRAEWLGLPEPRQNFLEWFAQSKSDVLAKEALRMVFGSGRKHDAAKAVNTILEHGKSKPKTQVEITNSNDVEFDLGKAMEVALQEKFGISPEKFQQFLKDQVQ